MEAVGHKGGLFKRWLGNAALVLAGLFFGFLLLEGLLRLARVEYPIFYTVDEHRGTAHLPGAKGWWRGEGEAYIRINSQGFRDREHAKTKPSGAFRVAVLGDSFVEAMQVPLEQAFWHLLERELQDCETLRGQKVEVMAFGTSGYGTAQELLTLRHQVWDYQPDVVILAFFNGNDVANNSRELQKETMKPYFVFRDGDLILDDSFKNTEEYRFKSSYWFNLGKRITNQSRVLQVLNEAKKVLNNARQAAQRGAGSEIVPDFVGPGMSEKAYHEPVEPAWREAWRVTEELLRLMNEEVKARGASFFVFTVSHGPQVYPDQERRREFAARFGIKDYFYPDRRLQSIGEKYGFPVLALAPAFQEYADANKVFLHGFKEPFGFGHWNTEGHRLASRLIAPRLCEEVITSRLTRSP